jgi:diguanylate cyclase (GGDEF)-like protein/PAS domain S-box-containing protein
MLNLDIRTLSFLVMLSSLLLALGLQIVNRVIKGDSSLRFWAIGETVFSAGLVLVTLRGFIPDLFSIVMANTLIIAGVVWQYLGNRSFQSRKNEFPWYWWLVAITAVLFFIFTYLTPNLSARIVTFSIILAAIRFASAFVLLRPNDVQDRLVLWFVAWAYLITVVFSVARGVINLLMVTTDQNFMAMTSTIQTFTFVFEIGLSLVLAIGLPLLVLGRTHRLLVAGENRYRTLIEWSPAPMVVLDGDKLRYVNPAAIKMLGAHSAQDLLGKYLLDFVHPDFHQFVKMRIKNAIETGDANSRVEEKIIKLDGTTIEVEVQSTSILYDGKPAVQVIMSDITEQNVLKEQIQQMAFFDPLTQLPNRRLLADRLSHTLSAIKRSGNSGALMMIDIDNFKPLNDAHGHHAGDLLLVEAARRLIACVRQIDTVARFGGDEFVVILCDLNADKTESAKQAGGVAEKIRASLAMPYQVTLNEGGETGITVEHSCSVSIGVALFLNPESSQDDILKWADAAMYQAKDAGRNVIRFYGLAQ